MLVIGDSMINLGILSSKRCTSNFREKIITVLKYKGETDDL